LPVQGLTTSVCKFSSASSIFRLFTGALVKPGSAAVSTSTVREALRERNQVFGVSDGSVNEDLNNLGLFIDADKGVPLPGEEDSSASEASSVPAPPPPTPSKRAFPGRRPYGRGTDKELDDIGQDADLINELDVDKFSGAGRYCHRVRVAWWVKRARLRCIDPFPVTPSKLALAAALLRKGGYRSAPMYLGALKREHISLGNAWSDELALEQRDCLRAVLRGIGPPARAAPFDLHAVAQLDAERVQELVDVHGPVAAKSTVLIASWWMLREIELAAANVGQITFQVQEGTCGTATFNLPVSKSDVQALGKFRTHVCTCPSPLCPVKAARSVVAAARTTWATTIFGETGEFSQFPLVPDFLGGRVTKRAMTAAFIVVAKASGMQEGQRITGHSPRVTGAQLMALAGISEWRIQVFGRWGSSAVLGYLRDTIISGAAGALAQEVVHATSSRRGLSVCDLSEELKLDPACAGAAFERAFSTVHDSAGGNEHKEAVLLLRKELDTVRSELAALALRAVPEAVVCTGSNKAHLVANARATHCGWPWALHAHAYRLPQDEPLEWCKRCCSTADRLRKGAVTQSP
jgi:hypothetical protein